jgi:hypothetical protein
VVRNVSELPGELEIQVPYSVLADGLGERALGPRGPADLCEALLEGSRRRLDVNGSTPSGRLVVVRAGPRIGSCTSWLLKGLGWMVTDLWVRQDLKDVRRWAREIFRMAFPAPDS